MSYHVNASSRVGAVSVPALTLEEAHAKAAQFKDSGYTNIVIIDAGTGLPAKDR